MLEVQDAIALEHPALIGHFPGRPIPPAVLLIQRLSSALENLCEGEKLTGLTRVRFKSPLTPGAAFKIVIESSNDGRRNFRLVQGDVTIMSGTALTA